MFYVYFHHSCLLLDWIMKETLDGQRLGVRWMLTKQLGDLIFNNNICFLSTTFQQMKWKTDKLSNTSGKLGLKMSAKKTKQIGINTTSETPLTVHDRK